METDVDVNGWDARVASTPTPEWEPHTLQVNTPTVRRSGSIESVTDTVARQVMNDQQGVTVEQSEPRPDAEPQYMSEAVLPATFDRRSAGGDAPLADAAPPRTCAPPALDEGSIPDRVAASATKTVLPNTSKRVVYRVTGGEHEPTGRPDDADAPQCHTTCTSTTHAGGVSVFLLEAFVLSV